MAGTPVMVEKIITLSSPPGRKQVEVLKNLENGEEPKRREQ
jgi:hypothetical protein